MLLKSQVEVGMPVLVRVNYYVNPDNKEFIGTVIELCGNMVKVSNEVPTSKWAHVYANYTELFELTTVPF